MRKLILIAFRIITEPLKTADISLLCQRSKNIPTNDKIKNQAVQKIIVETLRQLEKSNLVEAVGKEGLSLLWKIKD